MVRPSGRDLEEGLRDRRVRAGGGGAAAAGEGGEVLQHGPRVPAGGGVRLQALDDDGLERLRARLLREPPLRRRGPPEALRNSAAGKLSF